MAPRKPPKPNAFMLFVQALQKQHGNKYASLPAAIEAANPLWAGMSKEKRKPYEDQAKALRGTQGRCTSEGLNVDELTKQKQLQNQAEENARQDIRNTITMANNRNALDTEVFYLIHCNLFCYHEFENKYYPSEIAILSFTLKDGVKPENIFHFMVEPGRLPIGYKFIAKQHSDETHGIPIPDDDSKNNTEQVYYDLKDFLEKRKPAGTKCMPVLFADKKYQGVFQHILDSWAADYDTENVVFRVYNLQIMFYYLRNAVAGDQVWSSVTFSDRELEKDVYAYVPEIACPFHTTSSKPLFCSKSIVSRYAYVICDNCIADLNIEYIEGQHVPVCSAIPDSLSTYGGTSSRSSQSGRSSRRGFDNDFETDSNTDTWETESTASYSSVSTITSNFDEFPSLGRSRTHSQASNYGDGFNNSSNGKSYAGATGRSSLPVAFEKATSELSLKGSTGWAGFRRGQESDSEGPSVSGATPRSFAGSDFPPVGTGRGFGYRSTRKPGNQNSN